MKDCELKTSDPMGVYELKIKYKGKTKVKNVNEKQVEKKKHKIIVIGDSHAQGCTVELKRNVDKDFEVQGFVYPGTGVGTITTSAQVDIQHLTKQDVIVIWGGAKDVGKNETKLDLAVYRNLLRGISHANLTLMDVPHGYHLGKTSYINKEVEAYNRKLR
jgi:hypothetical protein